MILRGWSFRARLWAMVVLTAIVLAATLLADLWTSSQLDAQLAALEIDYLPLVEFGPQVEARLEAVRRAMQDSVVAQDSEGLEDTKELRKDVLAKLAEAPRIV